LFKFVREEKLKEYLSSGLSMEEAFHKVAMVEAMMSEENPVFEPAIIDIYYLNPNNKNSIFFNPYHEGCELTKIVPFSLVKKPNLFQRLVSFFNSTRIE
jgi:hypothetical protein